MALGSRGPSLAWGEGSIGPFANLYHSPPPDKRHPRPFGRFGGPALLHDEVEQTLSLKEIKVRIPVSFHLKLHAFKVLKGKPISDTIVEALEAYFKAAEDRKHPTPGMAIMVEGDAPLPPQLRGPQQEADDEPPRSR